MPRITKSQVEETLTNGLKLKEPRFRLQAYGGRINGSVISRTFERKRDHQRQDMIWDALEAEFGKEAVKKVGMILAYTPAEWDIDLPVPIANAKARR